MRTVTISEAKTHSSRLIEEIETGAEIIIARSRKPIAKLIGIVLLPNDMPNRIEEPEDT